MSNIDTTLAPPASEMTISRVKAEVNRLFDRLLLIQEQYALIRQLDESILNSASSAGDSLRERPFQIIVEKGLKHTGASHGQVVAFVRNRLEVIASSNPKRVGTVLPLDGSLCGQAVRSEKPQHCPDVTLLDKDQYVRFHRSTRSELVLLIRHEEGARILGCLALERKEIGPFDEVSISFAQLLAGQAALAFEQARRWRSVELLYQVSTDLLAGQLSPGQAYQKILDSVLETINFEHGQILKLTGRQFLIVASSRKSDLGLLIGSQNSISGHYLLTEAGREILRIPCVIGSKYQQYYLPLLAAASEEPMRSEMIVPIVDRGRLVGAINIESPQENPFSDFDEKLLGVVRDLMAEAFSATSTRNRLFSSNRIEAANLAMAQLGNVAQHYLHEFADAIGDARFKLVELKKHLQPFELPLLREEINVATFVEGIYASLGKATKTLRYFRDNFNPDKPGFQVEQTDLGATLQKCVEEFDRQIPEAIDITFDDLLPSETVEGQQIKGNALCELTAQIGDVLENLFTNAADAIIERRKKEPELRGHIHVVLDLIDLLSARVRVIDNGAGISRKDQKSIFGFGFSTKNRSGGIGLSFCRIYLYQRGGSIDFESTPGTGTTFTLIIPLVV